jgi:phage shock protein A
MQVTIKIPDELVAGLDKDATRRSIPSETVIEELKSLIAEMFQDAIQREKAETTDEEAVTEVIINEAIFEMKVNQIKHRGVAVTAITQKNNLQAEVEKLERNVREFERKAAKSLQAGDEELAKQFFQEKQQYEGILFTMRKSLLIATEATEKIKIAIKNEEAKIRRIVADAVTTKANLRLSEMLTKIYEASEELGLYSDANLSEAEQHRAFADWAEKQRSTDFSEGNTEQRIEAQLHNLRQQLDNLTMEWLQFKTQKTDGVKI